MSYLPKPADSPPAENPASEAAANPSSELPAGETPVAEIGSTDRETSIMDVIQGYMDGDFEAATSQLVGSYLLPAAGALLAIIVAYFVSKMVAGWVSTAICRRVDQTFGKFAGKFTFYTIFLVLGMAVLQYVGIPVTSVAALLAAAGFAVGLAFQGTLSNFASGVLLLVFRPFKVGDVVNAAGVVGKIYEIDLFTTKFDTPDNRRLIVPNSAIAGATIENVSHHAHRRVDVMVGVAYAASLDDTRDALTQAAESLGDTIVQGEGRGVQIVLGELGASSVDWTVRAWVASADYWAAKEELTGAVKRQLDERSLDIPFPQVELHLAASAEGLAPGQVETVTADRNLFQGGGGIRPRARTDQSS